MDKILQIFILVGFLAALTAAADIRYGTFINTLEKTAHGVSGDVYVVDANTIRLRNFYYDGKGPDAYFHIGKKGGVAQPSSQGEVIPDENGRMAILSGYSNADIILNLPSGVTVDMILWFSVWCRQATANFGSVMFPNTLTIPTTKDMGGFPLQAHEVKSTGIQILNSRQIKIMNFYYDGLGPDSYFWVGKGQPSSNGWAIPNDMGNYEILKAYNNKTFTLTLPHNTTIHDIDYLSVWCKKAVTSFSHVSFSSNTLVIPYVMNLEGYYGKLLGDLKEYAHDTRGTVYLVDANTIRIRHFYYDGKGPDSFFWIGSSDSPDNSGTIIPNEKGETTKLLSYTNADIVLTVPPGKIADSTWFSVWCKKASANFADITFPDKYTAPAKMVIGQFSRLAHGVKSGTVTLLSTKTIMIENLHYDGFGPDAYFWIGVGSAPSSSGWIVPDESGSTTKLSAYTGQTVLLTLPDAYSFVNYTNGRKIDWFSMWCKQAVQNFGNVDIPNDLFLPPYVQNIVTKPPLKNCEQLSEYFNLGWEIEGDHITYEFTGALGDGGDAVGYMSFGISGSTTRSAMIGADVFVVSYDSSSGAMAIDYKINAYALCSSNGGVCPDTRLGGTNDATNIEGYEEDGITTVRFQRPIAATDSEYDKAIPLSGDTYIVWAMGKLNADGLATKHDMRLQGNKMFNFGREGQRQCTPVKSRMPPVEVDPWKRPSTMGKMFTARIGPSGPENRGYAAIAKTPSWGIAWYIEGELIPELELQIGEEYTFKVQGGNDVNNGAKYHPFYITLDPAGGYAAKSQEEQLKEIVFAGVDADGKPTAVGNYCEYKTSLSLTEQGTSSYMDFYKSLILDCEPGEASMLKFTPTRDMPKLMYYQCYTHKYLGWKIHLKERTVSGASTTHVTLATLLIIAFSLMSRFL